MLTPPPSQTPILTPIPPEQIPLDPEPQIRLLPNTIPSPIMMMMIMLGIPPKQIQNILHTQFPRGVFPAAFNGLFGELAFLVLQLQDAGFDGVGDGEFVDGDVDGLVEAVDAVDGLFFDELRDCIISIGGL